MAKNLRVRDSFVILSIRQSGPRRRFVLSRPVCADSIKGKLSMSKETHPNHDESQFMHSSYETLNRASHDMMLAAVKLAGLVSGGAIVVLLAFASHLWSNGMTGQVVWLLLALAAFSFSLLFIISTTVGTAIALQDRSSSYWYAFLAAYQKLKQEDIDTMKAAYNKENSLQKRLSQNIRIISYLLVVGIIFSLIFIFTAQQRIGVHSVHSPVVTQVKSSLKHTTVVVEGSYHSVQS